MPRTSRRSNRSSKQRRDDGFPYSSRSTSLTPVLQQVHEVYSFSLSSTAAVISSTTAIAPASILLAARLTGYRAIADEVRLDLVRFELTPILGRSSTGRSVLYIERDPTAAAVGTVDLANDQREKVVGPVYAPLVLTWRPQEPADREFNLLNPGTVSLGSFVVISDSIRDVAAAPFTGFCYTVRVCVAMTLRGRP